RAVLARRTRLSGIAATFVALGKGCRLLLAHGTSARRHPDIRRARALLFRRAFLALARLPGLSAETLLLVLVAVWLRLVPVAKRFGLVPVAVGLWLAPVAERFGFVLVAERSRLVPALRLRLE